MFRQILKRGIFGAVPAVQLHNQDTYKNLYNYYAEDNKLKRSNVLKLFVGFTPEDDKSLDTLIPE